VRHTSSGMMQWMYLRSAACCRQQVMLGGQLLPVHSLLCSTPGFPPSVMCRWDDAIRVADTSRHPQTERLKQTHHEWLTTTGQYDRAASIKEREGDPLGAVHLYLRGGMPARAAQVGCHQERLAHCRQLAEALKLPAAKVSAVPTTPILLEVRRI
jgi:hypothetical protein